MNRWEEYASVHVVPRPTKAKRRRRCDTDPDRRKAKTILVWHALRKGGVSLRDIAEDTGKSHVTIHTYTSPGWVDWARKVLERGVDA